jgi:glycerophosphoryl diester phosphodiesterase
MPPLITAHRGASADAPENTLAALRLGFAQGADAAECDVRLTADGHAVLLHDATTRRTANRSLEVARSTLAELQTLDAGSWKAAAFAGERIPTLDAAITAVPAGRRLLVEIKCGPEIFPAIATALAAAARPPATYVLMSFDFAVAAEAKRRFPDIEAHWIVGRESLSAGRAAAFDSATLPALATRARSASLDGLNLDRRLPLDAAAVRVLHAAGLRVHVWTVDTAPLARRLAAAGVNSLTTNRPEHLRASLG